MHKILYYSGIFTGSITFIISFIIWFKLGIRKAFKDTINYGSKKRWAEDAGMKNKTMPLRKTRSGRLFAGKTEKKQKIIWLKVGKVTVSKVRLKKLFF